MNKKTYEKGQAEYIATQKEQIIKELVKINNDWILDRIYKFIIGIQK